MEFLATEKKLKQVFKDIQVKKELDKKEFYFVPMWENTGFSFLIKKEKNKKRIDILELTSPNGKKEPSIGFINKKVFLTWIYKKINCIEI